MSKVKRGYLTEGEVAELCAKDKEKVTMKELIEMLEVFRWNLEEGESLGSSAITLLNAVEMLEEFDEIIQKAKELREDEIEEELKDGLVGDK